MHPTLIIDLAGLVLTPAEIALIQHPGIAGILLFGRNIQNRTQLQHLTASIHALRPDVFIAIDHEGGFIQRIQRMGFRALPSARVLGEVYDLNPHVAITLAEQYGQIMARDLMACGIGVSFAPVLDLHDLQSPVIGQLDRAFHHDPDAIIALASATVRGMHKAGMCAIGKHFPGHGSCFEDSHVAIPVNHKSLDELRESDLKPFQALIKAGLLDGIMPAHVIYTQIDPDFAAGFSPLWLQEQLREKLAFNGLVISDCLGMKGADIGDLNQRANQALLAGCELLIVSHHSPADILNLLNHLPEPSTELQARLHAFQAKMAPIRVTPHESSDFAVEPDTR
ncbi:MAG: beta-N-acetylhexosaminidase, partial [Legionella sp. 21-45-4]